MLPLPHSLTVAGLLDDYRHGRRSPQQVAAQVIERIRASTHSGVWISLVPDNVLIGKATQLGMELARDPVAALAAKPLLGIPYSVKDNIDVAGMETTAACPDFSYRPARSAGVVDKLEAAGAILVGKTNLDQFATGLVGMRTPYGDARNPFNPDYIAGGSSTGSALSTVLGQVAFSLGTDTAGSGRVPAAFNNLVGIKPTPGLIGNQGVFPACRTLDCVSVFSHTVADAWQVLGLLADSSDVYIAPPRLASVAAKKVRFGVPVVREFFGDSLAREAFSAALAALRGDTDFSFHDVAMDSFDQTAALLYSGPWVAERRAAIGNFFHTHGEMIDPSVRQIIAAGDRMSAVDAFDGQYSLAELRHLCGLVFSRIDVLVVPSTPTIYRREDIRAQPLLLNTRLGKYTNFVNLLGLAALALPGPFRSDGLPAGITLIGPGGSDYLLAEIGRRIEGRLHMHLGLSHEPPPRCDTPLPPLMIGMEAMIDIAVVGAHLAGQPLNWQLVERDARMVEATTTSADYRLYALPDTVPPKPGLARVRRDGCAIEVEVWRMPMRRFGDFVAEVPAPMTIGTVELTSGRTVKSFFCEPIALQGATDISEFGGWRHYLASR